MGAGHVREQVVLYLAVEAAQQEVHKPAAGDIPGGQDLAAEEVHAAVLAGRTGMPLWFGAKDAPM